MSLPPVVSDPDFCAKQSWLWEKQLPHDFEKRPAPPLSFGMATVEVCRYCGGRKP